MLQPLVMVLYALIDILYLLHQLRVKRYKVTCM